MSQLPSDLPQLPKWPFLLTDALLLGTAAAIAWCSNGPLQGWAVFAVMLCVGLAALLCAIPFVTEYARSQDQALDERQRSLEALAKTVSASSEQLGIAVQGLSRLDEQLQRHIRHIDQVPQKINERLGDLQQRLASTRDGEIEELERELAALKSSEGDRLEGVVDQIQRAAAELARLEQASARHAEQANAQVAAFEAAANAASQRLAATVDHSIARSSEALADTLLSIRSSMDALLSEANAKLVAQFEARLAESRGQLVREAELACTRIQEFAAAQRIAAPHLEPAAPVPALQPEPAANPLPTSPEPVLAATFESPLSDEPASLPVEPAPEAPVSAELPAASAPQAVVAPPGRQPRKKPEPVPPGMVLDLFNEHFSLEDPLHHEPLVSRSFAADGATRVLVTAYIGIGNKLYIRGDGPGLSWDKGQPLQFVSIGKWRWESLEAESSFSFKLLKNDHLECASIGVQRIDAGQQAELTATF